MPLSNFAVVHERGNASTDGDPLVRCHDGRQRILAFVELEALEDYFRIPGDEHHTLRQWNLVVDRNLEAFKRIIGTKYERNDWEVHNAYGQSYPKLVVTLEDMQRSGDEFTIDAGFCPSAS
jgi:hypothetical protein